MNGAVVRQITAVLGLLALALLFSGVAAADSDLSITAVDATSVVDPGDTVRVDIRVKNTAGVDAYEVEITAEGFGKVRETTRFNFGAGETKYVTLYIGVPDDMPDGFYDIDVSAQSREDDGTVLGEDTETVAVEVDDDPTDDDPDDGDSAGSTVSDVELQSVETPSRLRPGQQFTANVTVKNTGTETLRRVDVRFSAWGQTKTVDGLRLNRGELRTVTLSMTVPADASGPEDAEVQAVARTSSGSVIERDISTVRLTVDPTALTLQVRPTEVLTGDHVQITGMMDRAGAEARLYIGGLFQTTLTADATKHYAYTYVPEDSGTTSIVVRAGAVRKQKTLRVRPRVAITSVTGADTVNTGERFTLCSLVTRGTAGPVHVAVRRDGTAVAQRDIYVDERQETCFDLSVGTAGDHTYTVEATADGMDAQATHTVTAVESTVSVSVFPEQLTLQRGQAGVIQVKIENDDAHARTFTVNVSGIANITEQSRRTVALGSQESTTVYLRVVPTSLQTYTGKVTVTANGKTYAATPVMVTAVANPGLKIGVLADLREAVAAVQHAIWQWKEVLATVLAVLVIGLWLVRTHRFSPLEPRY